MNNVLKRIIVASFVVVNLLLYITKSDIQIHHSLNSSCTEDSVTGSSRWDHWGCIIFCAVTMTGACLLHVAQKTSDSACHHSAKTSVFRTKDDTEPNRPGVLAVLLSKYKTLERFAEVHIFYIQMLG
jgi:hypothetical protein